MGFGLKTPQNSEFGVWGLILKHPDVLRNLFVPGPSPEVVPILTASFQGTDSVIAKALAKAKAGMASKDCNKWIDWFQQEKHLIV